MSRKQVIGSPLEIGGRMLSLSRAIRAGDFVFVTGQVPMRDGAPMTDGTIEEQTRACIESLREILAEAGCELADVVKSMVWLKRREDFPAPASTADLLAAALIHAPARVPPSLAPAAPLPRAAAPPSPRNEAAGDAGPPLGNQVPQL